MKYTKKEHKRNILNGIVSSLTAGIFVGVFYDTNGNWIASLIATLIYAIPAYWISWFFLKDKKK